MKLIDLGTRQRVAWGVLAVLLLLLLGGAFTYNRPDLRLLPGEATVLMQAQSLAVDGDLRYERLDFDRILLQLSEPPDLELTSGTGGRRLTFDRPFPYALWLAPFVAWRPETGFAVANALLLAAAALWAAWALARRSGAFGPLWIAALVFATPILTSVFRADGDAYLVAAMLAAVGFAVRSGDVAGDRYRGPSSRHAMAVGVCLALAGTWHFLWLVLPLAFLLLWRQSGPRVSMLLGFAVGTLPQVVVQWWVGGGLHFVGAVRGRFTPATGFPSVDFSTLGSTQGWNDTVHRLSSLHFEGAPVLSWGFDFALWTWNVVYLLIGRHLGLVPYAAVALVALVAMPASRRGPQSDPGRGLWAWLAAGCGAVVLLLVFRPFQLFEVASLGPTPLLPLLVLAPLARATAGDGALAPRRAWLGLALCLAMVAPFLWPMWMSPRAQGVDDSEGLAPSRLAVSLLPYETSQQNLPGGTWEDVAGLRVRFLDPHGWGESRRERLVMESAHPARMLVASSVPLDGLVLDFGAEASTQLEVGGGKLGELLLRPSGGVGFQIDFDDGRRHVMWWSPGPRWLYFLDLSFETSENSQAEFPSQNLPFRVGAVPKGGVPMGTETSPD